MQRPSLLVSVLAAVTAPVLLGQDAPKPSVEMEKYAALIGAWQGVGTAVVPDAGEMPWTASIRAEWILDGFFVGIRGEMRMGASAPMQFQSIYGWDQENRRHVAYGCGNTGEGGGVHEVAWVDAKTLVVAMATVTDGVPALTRSTFRFDDDRYDYVMERATGTGAFDVEVRGAFERIDELETRAEEVAFPGTSPIAAPMQRLARIAGTFDTAGWMSLGSDGKIDLTGTETVAVRFGGHVLEKTVVGSAGDSPPWKSSAFTTWNERGQRYDTVTFSNYGEVSSSEMRFVDDDTLVVMAMHLYGGRPMLWRSIVTLGENGPTVAESHTIEGAGEPAHSFHMEYAPRK